jgi:hypothetical protein
MSDFVIPGEKPQQESYKDEVIYIPNSGVDSKGDTTLQDWMFMEITPDKYYMAIINEESVSFTNDLNKHRIFKRKFFETKQERRDKKIEILLNIDN